MNNSNNMGNSFMAFIMGAAAGAAAVAFSDPGKRRMIKSKFDNMMGEVEEVKDKGKEKIRKELDRAQAKLK
jgi:hypothetical protein